MDNTRRTLLGLIVTIIVALVVMAITQLTLRSERLTNSEADATLAVLTETRIAVMATAELFPTPTLSVPEPTPEATTTNYDLLLELANEWPLLAYEPFDDNRRGWSVGGNGVYSRGERGMVDGSYRWQLTAVEGFYWWTAPIDVPFDNFYAEVQIDKQDRVSADTSLVFRYKDGDNYYEFGLCDDVTQYRVIKETLGTRTTLVACTAHPASKASDSNRLAVIGQTDRYLLFINDRYVATVDDDDHAVGGVGVGLDMDEGAVNVIEFDDMVVRSADLESTNGR